MATFNNREKSGKGWYYDEPTIKYDSLIDPVSGAALSYNSVGEPTTFTNTIKN